MNIIKIDRLRKGVMFTIGDKMKALKNGVDFDVHPKMKESFSFKCHCTCMTI